MIQGNLATVMLRAVVVYSIIQLFQVRVKQFVETGMQVVQNVVD